VVVAGFDGGGITSNAGALLPWCEYHRARGQTDEFHARDLLGAFGFCFGLSAKIAIDQRNMAERLALQGNGGGVIGRVHQIVEVENTHAGHGRSAIANQVRLVLHTAAYWLMLAVREAIPKARNLASAEFARLRLRLIKIAVRVCMRLAFAASCPEADLFRSLPDALIPLGP